MNNKADKKSEKAAKKASAKRAASKPSLFAGGNAQIKQIAAGVMHEVPPDLQDILTSDLNLLAKWNDLTPIQRNEWICWVTIVKGRKQEPNMSGECVRS
jgi:hypothetical protein